MKIGYLSAEWTDAWADEYDGKPSPGGSGWYRCHMPAAELAKNGYETVVAENVAMSDRGLVICDHEGVVHYDCDVIVMQRLMHESAYNLVRVAQDGGQIVVNDVDDWYWGLHPSNAAYNQSDPVQNPEVNREHYKAAIMASDLVTTSTPFLAERIADWGCNVQVVRNCIDLERWKPHPQRRDPIVGWVGSVSHRSDDLETVADAVGPFVNENNLGWHHSGYFETEKMAWAHPYKILGIDPIRSTTSPLCSIRRYPLQFGPIDIGIVPLNKIDFNEAKSFIKGLEYAASGVPFVAQDTAEYVLLEQRGVGVTASDTADWREKLESFLDYDARCAEAAKNLEAVQAFDIAANWQEWVKAYESA